MFPCFIMLHCQTLQKRTSTLSAINEILGFDANGQLSLYYKTTMRNMSNFYMSVLKALQQKNEINHLVIIN